MSNVPKHVVPYSDVTNDWIKAADVVQAKLTNEWEIVGQVLGGGRSKADGGAYEIICLWVQVSTSEQLEELRKRVADLKG